MKRVLMFAVGFVAVLMLLIQFVRPERTNPPASNPFEFSSTEVETIVRRSCFDCHSNETKWPWYSNVAPVSWSVIEHVNHARKEMNFSDWDNSDIEHLAEEICEEIEKKGMPHPQYLWMHRDAALSESDIRVLCTWASTLAKPVATPNTGEAEHEELED